MKSIYSTFTGLFKGFRPSDTSPIFCGAKHRGGGLIPFCHIILSKEKDCIYPSPLPCSVALRGVALAIGETPKKR